MMSIIKPSLRAAGFSYNTTRAWKSSLLSSQEAGQIKNQQSFLDPLEKWSQTAMLKSEEKGAPTVLKQATPVYLE